MENELLKVISRIKATQDGIDYMDFLERLSKQNYVAFKNSPSEMNDIHKGQAIAIDELHILFVDCDKMLEAQSRQPNQEVPPEANPYT